MSSAIENSISEFITNGKSAKSHPAKLLVFSRMLNEVFGVNIEDIIPGVEKKLGSKLLGLRGSIDLIFSGVIIELKIDLEKEWITAKSEVIKYFQCLKDERPNDKYVAIATDLIRFRALLPKLDSNGVATELSEIGFINADTATSAELLVWLDSFVFSSRNQPPTAEDLKIRFGAGSPTYALAIQELQEMWENVGKKPEETLKINLWKRNMQIVYGREPQDPVFVDHTYVVTLVKLIVYLRLSGAKIIKDEELGKALSGDYFLQFGIQNLIEEDFFTWILDNKILKETLLLAKRVAQGLLNYDLTQINEDLFKELYQQIVRQGERHRVGEYYTPEWLSQLTTERLLGTWCERNTGVPHVLDPACGSGTFITNSIHYILQKMIPQSTSRKDALDTILSHVMGLDVNPLAVTISRANYILALGTLIQYSQNINIPIYNSDSIRIPKAALTISALGKDSVYDLEIDSHHIQLPVKVATDRAMLGVVVSGLHEALTSYSLHNNKAESVNAFLRIVSPIVEIAETKILTSTLQTLMKLEDVHQNSIWLFVINNFYAPLFMKEHKFDILISNPPWIVMRSIESKVYQEFLKEQVFSYGLLKSKQTKLFTQMEMATLFFCRSMDLYLKDCGDIAFLMPISVITAAEQHVRFKLFKNPETTIREILNFENITNIFSLPVCVLVGSKGGKNNWPVPMNVYRGKIDPHNKNARLNEIELAVTMSTYSPPVVPEKSEFSHYYSRVKVGASIFPRNFWFVEFVLHPTLRTIDPSKPLFKTSEKNAEVSKKEWKDIRLSGNVEREYVYATLLGKDTIPFGHLDFRPVVLPVECLATKMRVLSRIQVQANGAIHFASWFEEAQKIFACRQTEKSKISFPNVEDRLDYQKTLSSQDPSKKFVVLYNARGADSMTCVVNRNNIPDFEIDHSSVRPVGYVADYTTYMFETNNEDEAHYLCAFLNSSTVHKNVKSFQPRGKYGKRDIGRRPFQLTIPKFSSKDANHLKLAELSKECHEKVRNHKFAKKGFRGMRNEASSLLANEITEVNLITASIL